MATPNYKSRNPFDGINVGSHSSPTFADIDGDNDLDLVVGEVYGTVKYYKNTGTAAAPSYTLQAAAVDNPFDGINVGYRSSPTFADIDGDNDLDLVVGADNGTVKYYKNTRTAAALSYTLQTAAAANPFNSINVGYRSSPTFADIDGDNDLDLVVGANDGAVKYYKNTGTAAAPSYTLQTAAADNPFDGTNVAYDSSPTFADIDGDNDLDLVVGAYDGTVRYYKNTGTAAAPSYTLQTAAADNPFDGINVGGLSSPTFADIDGDNDLDLVVGADNGTVKYYKNTRTAAAPSYPTADVGDYSSPTFADIDGDNDLDLVVGEYNGTVKYYKNTGTAAAPSYTLQTAAADNPFDGIDVGIYSSPTFADIDGDNDLDLVVGERNGTVRYYKNTGTAAAPSYTLQTAPANNPFNGINVENHSNPTFADIDGDNDLDLVVGEYNGTVRYYKNTGTAAAPSYTLQTAPANNPFNGINVGNHSKPTFADIDGDNDLDLVVGERNGTVKYYKNTGTAAAPSYTLQTAAADNPFDGINVAYLSSPTFADIDGDNDLDLVVGGSEGTVKYYYNESATNQAPINTIPSAQTVSEDIQTAITGISVTDPDGNLASTQLTVTKGKLSVTLTGGVTLVGTNNSATFTLTGTQTQINAALSTLKYQGNLNINGTDTLTILSTDSSGTPLTDTDDIIITITGTNDAPTVATPIADKTATENSQFNFTIPAGTFTDIDAGDSVTYSTATLANGSALPTWLTFNATTGTFSGKPLAANVTTLNVKVTARDNSNATVSDTFDLVINPLTFTGSLTKANNLTGTASGNTMTGGGVNDIISGGAGNDTLYGNEGNDRLNGGNDNDTLYGGNSNDLLYGDAGNDTILGDAGNDNLNGGAGNDVLIGGIGNDILNGDADNDILDGGIGNDRLNGGAGNDSFYGGAGDDSFYGGTGDDTFIVNVDTAQGKDLINGDAGIDTLDFTGSIAAVNVNLAKTTAQTVSSNLGSVSPNLVLTVLNLENVKGGSGNDTLAGNSLNNRLTGGDGADKFGFGGKGIPLVASLGVDTISDFTVADNDKIQLSKSTFSMLTTIGTLAADKFTQIASNSDADAATAVGSIVYNSNTGNLFYNSNAGAAGFGTNGGQFANIGTSLTLNSSMFEVIA